jgi:hypothetical protein
MEACPRHWQAVYLDKTADLGNKKTFEGDIEHKKLEDAIKQNTTPENKFAAEVLGTLRALGGRVEAEKWLSVDREFKHAPYGTPAYLRCKADVMVTYKEGKALYIGDWKTGKWAPRDDSEVDYTQLRINAIAALGMKPNAEKAVTALIYTEKKKVFPLVIKREEITKPSSEFQDLYVRFQNYERAQGSTTFEARQCRMCSFCPVATCHFHPGYDG